MIEEIKSALNLSNIVISNSGIGEQGYLLSKINSPIFFVASNEENAYKISEQLNALGKKNVLIDSFDSRYSFSKFQSKDNLYKTINALMQILNDKVDVIVTTLDGFFLQTMNKKDFELSILHFKKGECYNLSELSKNLVQSGYKRVDAIEQIGDFSLRGDLLDVYPSNSEYPIRINFFDDEVETIIHFDNINLTKIKDLDEVSIAPNSLFCLTDTDKKVIEKNMSELVSIYQDNSIYEYLNLNSIPYEFFKVLNFQTASLIDYLESPILVFQNPLNLISRLEKTKEEIYKHIDIRFKNTELKNKLINLENKDFDNLENYFNLNKNNKKIKNNCIFIDNTASFNKKLPVFDIKSKNINNYLKNIELIKTDFSTKELKEKTIKLCLNNEDSLKSVKEVLFNLNVPFSTDENKKGFVLTSLKIPYNICSDLEDVWYIGSTNFAHKKEFKIRKGNKIKFLPKAGEYVVHEVHGIGLCEGVVTLKVMGAEKDFFKIIYAKNSVLYVPTENTDSLSLYMGGTDIKLNKLGGKEFALTKYKTQKSIEDMAKELLELYAERSQAKGFKYSKDNYLMTEFEHDFIYSETADQLQAIEDVKRDMESGKVMDRLICGDVGYGKTEVAMRACFKTFLDGKQVAVLAPTTILSLQHYLSFSKRMESFGVRVEMLNRFKTTKEKAEIISKLKNGEIDVICGTHSLLSDGVAFKDLGLLILDEEQRFGVKAKEKLKTNKLDVNVLTMSATPIPRTLNMAMLTLRDISIINTPPKNRLPVKTQVLAFDYDICAQAVAKEVNRGGQVLIVYNNIEKIYAFTSKLKNILSDEKFNFDVAHGKMTKVELENAVKRLYDQKTNVFVSTTLIENGVDLPRANTLIVLESQNLGLSEMYQLRGRVGRNTEQAYAYFTYPKNRTLTIEASDRLEAIAENTDLGSGFKIAMRDLQLRGAGELLGKVQHGNMIKVGYDLYVQLLEDCIKRLKGEKVAVKREVKIDIAISARIPTNFVVNEMEKLQIYSKISSIEDKESQRELIDKLKESYGTLPKEIIQLTNVALIKAYSEKVGVKQIIINKDRYSIIFYEENFDVKKILNLMPKFYKFSIIKAQMPTISLKPNEFSPITAQGYFLEFLTSLVNSSINS